MGIYGVAFSAGLTIAALLGALGAANGWRVAFWCAAGLAAAAFVATWPVRLGPPSGSPVSLRFPAKAVVGLPTVIGAVGAVCQYGAIPFLTTFAVVEWGLRAGQAAALLAVGRVFSIVAKVVSGAGSDRRGPIASARTTGLVVGLTGIAWVTLPAGWPAYACAAAVRRGGELVLPGGQHGRRRLLRRATVRHSAPTARRRSASAPSPAG